MSFELFLWREAKKAESIALAALVEYSKQCLLRSQTINTKTMNKTFKLLPPLMPNFLAFEIGPQKRQQGFVTNRVSVTELSEQEAIEYGELMKQAFIEHWKNKKLQQSACS